MRTKDDILQDLSDKEAAAPNWTLASLSQEQLRLEVWIDIRDILDRFFTAANFLVDDILSKK